MLNKKFVVIGLFCTSAATLYLTVNYLTWDHQILAQVQTQLNQQSSNSSFIHKVSANSRTASQLTRDHTFTLKLLGDNQGSGHLLYYPVAVNQRTTFWLTIAVDSYWRPQPNLKQITYYPKN